MLLWSEVRGLSMVMEVIKVGKKVMYNKESVPITRHVDLNRVAIEEIDSGIVQTLHISQLSPTSSIKPPSISIKSIHTLIKRCRV